MTSDSGGIRKRALWDLTIWAAGLVYMALVLFVNLDSPLFGLLLIVLAAYALLEPRRQKRGRHYDNERRAQSLR
jgi:uncharacterized membrane protein YfcA